MVSCRAGGGPSRRSGCGAWFRRTSSSTSRTTPASETVYRNSRRGLPRETYPQAWLPTCFSKPSYRHRNQWDFYSRRIYDSWPLHSRTERQYVILSLWLAQNEEVSLLFKLSELKSSLHRNVTVCTPSAASCQLWDGGQKNNTSRSRLEPWDQKCNEMSQLL